MSDAAPAAPKGGKQAPKVAKKGEKRAGKKGGKIGSTTERSSLRPHIFKNIKYGNQSINSFKCACACVSRGKRKLL